MCYLYSIELKKVSAGCSKLKVCVLRYSLSKYPCSATFLILSNIVLRAGRPTTNFVLTTTGNGIVGAENSGVRQRSWRKMNPTIPFWAKIENFLKWMDLKQSPLMMR
jgi:hypothetical protein